MRPRTDTQTDTQTRVTTIHFALSTTHTKCKKGTNEHTIHKSKEWRLDVQYEGVVVNFIIYIG